MKENRLFFIIYLCFWMAENNLSPYLGLYYENRGLSGTQIGVISSVFSAAVVLSALGVGMIGDKFRDSRKILISLCGGMILGVGGLAAGSGYLGILAAVILYGCAYSPFNGIVDKLLMDRMKGREEKFGIYRMGGTVGAGIGVLLAGVSLIYLPFSSVFINYWLIMAVCAFFVLRLPVSKPVSEGTAGWKDYYQVIRHKSFLPIYIPMVIWGITESGVMQFQALHVARCGYSSIYTSIFIAAAMLGESLMFAAVHQVLKRLGKKNTIALAYLLQFGRAAGLALLGIIPLPVVIFLQMTGGGAYASLYSTITQAIGETFPEKTACTAHNLKLVVTRGIGASIGFMLLGVLYDQGRSSQAYCALAGVAALFSFWMCIKKEELC